jgi:pyroglutamyl-peptidase
MKPITVLVTAFEPFGGEPTNPSAGAVELLQHMALPGVNLHTMLLPVEFIASQQRLWQTLARLEPDLVLCVGQAGGRTHLSLEQVGINLLEARIPDNAGFQPSGLPVITDGPAAYFSNLPLKAALHDLQAAGIPASISYSAGTYVCNATLYNLMDWIQRHRPQCRGGFVHIPFAPAQVLDKPLQPSMALPIVASGLRSIIQSCLQHAQDIHGVVGTLD